MATLFAKEPRPALPLTQGKVVYQDVVEVSGTSAAELMKRARAWVAYAYRSAPDVTKDITEDRIIIKGLMPITLAGLFKTDVHLRHVLTIEIKEGRFRYTLSDLEIYNPNDALQVNRPIERYVNDAGEAKTGCKSVVEATAANCPRLLSDLAAYMQKPAEDW